jgi:hypothetical protein
MNHVQERVFAVNVYIIIRVWDSFPHAFSRMMLKGLMTALLKDSLKLIRKEVVGGETCKD